MSKQLILGGARSGKSGYAEEQAIASAKEHQQSLWYVATANHSDDHEMQRRIKQHQQRRQTVQADAWRVIEEPLDLAAVLQQYATKEHCVLVDCLSLWLTNALLNNCWEEKKAAFFQAFNKSAATLLLVSNEVGSGIVPLGELSRQFVDESGLLHQRLAAHSDRVTLVVAGLPLQLKG